jgi:adenine-specific DNA-methyltransferase
VSYRYLGNKTRLATWISSTVREVIGPAGRLADLMCGTGAVAERFAQDGYEVIAGDQLYFPCLHARARLLFSDNEIFRQSGMSYSDTISHLNELEPISGFFSQEYGEEGKPSNGRDARLYFSKKNAGRIDAIRNQIRTWRLEGVSPFICDLLLHDLILATNDVANISGTYGYFQSSLSRASLKNLEMTETVVCPPGNHQVVHGSVFETLQSLKVDLLYLDPPYTKRQYAGNYHILETIAMEDEPSPVGDGGLREWSTLSSPFCYRRRAPEAISNVMNLAAANVVMWSYSADGQVSLEDFKDILSNFGKVEVRKANLPRFRSNSGGEGGTVDEYLLICDRRTVSTNSHKSRLGGDK